MTIEAYRIVKTRYGMSAFDGEGAKRYGGRWNSVGTAVVYTSSTISLATLEILVHVDDLSLVRGLYSIIPVRFDESLVQWLSADELPPRWSEPEVSVQTQLLGDRWIREARSAALAVPSAVTPPEWNFLLNPAHRDFAAVNIGTMVAFEPDPRLSARGGP